MKLTPAKMYDRALMLYVLRRYDKAIEYLERIVVLSDYKYKGYIIDNPLVDNIVEQEEIIYLLIKCCQKSDRRDLMYKYCNLVLIHQERYKPEFVLMISELIS